MAFADNSPRLRDTSSPCILRRGALMPNTPGRASHALSLVELARAGPDQQLTAAELAARADAPRKFLEAILLELARRNVVQSRRGKFGGYILARPADAVSFADVIRVIDGPLALAPCVSHTAFRKCDDCPDLETCSLRPALRMARDATAAVLESYSLQHAVDDSSGARTAAIIGLAP
jgi:Rrf2 family protein